MRADSAMLSARLALTLKHPWPWMVCHWDKRIENRTWHPGRRLRRGEWFFLHGGKVPTTPDGLEDVREDVLDLFAQFGEPDVASLTLSDIVACAGIVAVVRFGGTIDRSDNRWFEGPIGWELDEVVTLPKPIPCPGAQGLWVVPELIRAEAIEQAVHVTGRQTVHARNERGE